MGTETIRCRGPANDGNKKELMTEIQKKTDKLNILVILKDNIFMKIILEGKEIK